MPLQGSRTLPSLKEVETGWGSSQTDFDMAAAAVDGEAASIKKAFRRWDRDGSGVITRKDLEEVMKGITRLTPKDLDRLMAEVDTNGNGVIEYEEFVDWLMAPAKSSMARAMIDFSSILKPLFNVYDRNGDGTISLEEFTECHSILQSALRECRDDDGNNPFGSDPLDLAKSAKTAFREADTTCDNVISFRDFVEWIGGHLTACFQDASVPKEELQHISKHLSMLMNFVFQQQEVVKLNPVRIKGASQQWSREQDEKVLKRLLQGLAATAIRFEQACVVGQSEAQGWTWTDPPVGMSVERLKGTHMRVARLNVRKADQVEDISHDILCVPSRMGHEDASTRRWYAEVVRRVRMKSGTHAVDPPAYYAYEALRWEPLQNTKEFEKALEELPPEICVFCLLKTEANFGTQLTWDQILHGLNAAVEMDLIKREQVGLFESHIKDTVTRLLEEDGVLCGQSSPSAYHKTSQGVIEEFVREQVRLRPRLVMAKLSELEICQVSPVWVDFMRAGDDALLELC